MDVTDNKCRARWRQVISCDEPNECIQKKKKMVDSDMDIKERMNTVSLSPTITQQSLSDKKTI